MNYYKKKKKLKNISFRSNSLKVFYFKTAYSFKRQSSTKVSALFLGQEILFHFCFQNIFWKNDTYLNFDNSKSSVFIKKKGIIS